MAGFQEFPRPSGPKCRRFESCHLDQDPYVAKVTYGSFLALKPRVFRFFGAPFSSAACQPVFLPSSNHSLCPVHPANFRHARSNVVNMTTLFYVVICSVTLILRSHGKIICNCFVSSHDPKPLLHISGTAAYNLVVLAQMVMGTRSGWVIGILPRVAHIVTGTTQYHGLINAQVVSRLPQTAARPRVRRCCIKDRKESHNPSSLGLSQAPDVHPASIQWSGGRFLFPRND